MHKETPDGSVYIVWKCALNDCITRARVVALTAIYLNHHNLTTKMRHAIDNAYDKT